MGRTVKIAVVYTPRSKPQPGQPPDYYVEGDDPATIASVVSALSTMGEAVAIFVDSCLYDNLRAMRPDLVFNMAEGVEGEGREAMVPALLEMMGIPYTGSGPLTMALTLNKARCKEVLRYHRIPTPRSFIMASASPLAHRPSHLSFPLVVKPISEGSSKGIRDRSLVHDEKELKTMVSFVHETYRQHALVEEFLPGREFTAAILGNTREARVLPLVEINHSCLPEKANPIYSYEAKWVWDTPEDPLPIFLCPAPVDGRLLRMIKEAAMAAYFVLGCRDWCRVDIRLDKQGVPCVLELNPLPGILPDPADNSCFPKAAQAAGMDYGTLIRTVVDSARKRYNL